jgi:hypothetical protein
VIGDARARGLKRLAAAAVERLGAATTETPA